MDGVLEVKRKERDIKDLKDIMDKLQDGVQAVCKTSLTSAADDDPEQVVVMA